MPKNLQRRLLALDLELPEDDAAAFPDPHLPLQSGLTTGVELPHELSLGAVPISTWN